MIEVAPTQSAQWRRAVPVWRQLRIVATEQPSGGTIDLIINCFGRTHGEGLNFWNWI